MARDDGTPDFDRTLHCGEGAGKLEEETVARGLHLARAVARQQPAHHTPRCASSNSSARASLRCLVWAPSTPPPKRLDVERSLALERLVWERVNEQRHERYTRAWKNFYLQWRQEENWEWPTSEQFWLQHRRLVQAVARHGLPQNPLADARPEQLRAAAQPEARGGEHSSTLTTLMDANREGV